MVRITKQNFKKYLKSVKFNYTSVSSRSKKKLLEFYNSLYLFEKLYSYFRERFYLIEEFRKGLVIAIERDDDTYSFIYLRKLVKLNKFDQIMAVACVELEDIEKIYMYEKMYEFTILYNKDFLILDSEYFHEGTVSAYAHLNKKGNGLPKGAQDVLVVNLKKELESKKLSVFLKMFFEKITINYKKANMLYIEFNNKPIEQLSVFEKFLKLFLYESDISKFNYPCFTDSDFCNVFNFLKALKFKKVSFSKIKKFYKNNNVLFHKKSKIFLLFLECLIIYLEKMDILEINRLNNRIENFLNYLLKNLLDKSHNFIEEDFRRVLVRIVLFFGYSLRKKVKLLDKIFNNEVTHIYINNNLKYFLNKLNNLYAMEDILLNKFSYDEIFSLQDINNLYSNEFIISNLLSNTYINYKFYFIFRRRSLIKEINLPVTFNFYDWFTINSSNTEKKAIRKVIEKNFLV